MKRRYKYTLIVELAGIIGSYIIYAYLTGRFDIWNLPDGLFRMFLVSTIVIGVLLGIFVNLVENELYK